MYFVTQNPADVPDEILGQLGNRVQHALRAFTAKDQKDLRQAAETYRPNPNFDTAEAIREVGMVRLWCPSLGQKARQVWLSAV